MMGLAVGILFERVPAFGAGMLSLIPFVTFLVLAAAYLAWCKMAWDCAKNVETKVWGTIAKVVIVLGLIRSAGELLRVFEK